MMHSVENCRAFKANVQELINNKSLVFKDDSPNVKNNPLPTHNSPSINAIEECLSHSVIKEVEKLKTPLSMLHAKLVKFDLIGGSHDDCEECIIYPERCKVIKKYIQELMNQDVAQINHT